MNEVVEQVFPRPPQIPDEVSNLEIIQVVRAFLYGESYHACCALLGIELGTFMVMIRGACWRELQNQFRDEFLATTGNRLVRLEQKVLDKIEHFLDEGVESVYFGKNGAEQYVRGISPREAAVIARTLMETNKRLDKMREGDVNRKKFDFQERIRRLESIANAKVIDGDTERAA